MGELRRLVAEAVQRPLRDVGVDQRLTDLGLESLAAARLQRRIRELLTVNVPIVEFLGDATVETINRYLGTAPTAAPLPPDRVDLEETGRFTPFGLTDIQGAYWAGRGGDFPLGNVATYFYQEYDRESMDVSALEEAWNRLVAQHDMLRAIIGRDGMQRVMECVPRYRIRTLDLRATSPDETEEILARVREELSHQVLPADQWPLFDLRATLLPGGGMRVHLGFDVLVLDFTSFTLLMSQWKQLVEDPSTTLPKPTLRYRDYIRWYADDKRREEAGTYWRDRLDTLPSGPRLPLAVDPASVSRPHFVRRSSDLASAHWAVLRAQAARRGLSPSGLLLGAFAFTLRAWGAGEPFSVNVTLFNRPPIHPEIDQVVGDFTTTTLLAVETGPIGDGDPSFAALARRVNEQLWRDLEHSAVSGVEVQRELARRRGPDQSAFPVVFTSGIGSPHVDPDRPFPTAWLGRQTFGVSQTPQVWLDHQVREENGRLMFDWDAVEALFPSGYLDGMITAYRRLLVLLAEDKGTWTRPDLGYVPGFPASPCRVRDKTGEAGTLHGLARMAAITAPNAPAVISSSSDYSHGELWGHVDRVRGLLEDRGVGAGSRVAVVMEKCPEQVVAVLAVLDAGAAYIPVDPRWPPERIQTVLRRADAKIAVIGTDRTRAALPENVTVLHVGAGAGQNASATIPASPGPAVPPDGLAYIIYTSGSTGVPKGVAIEHGAARNTVDDINARFRVSRSDRVLALSALSFDLSVYDIFGVLGAVGAVVMPDAGRLRDPQHWCDLIRRHDVTLWNTAPAVMEMLVEYCEADPDTARRDLGSLRLVLLSGDWIPITLPDRLRALAPGARVISLGGATEASIWSIHYPIARVDPQWRSIPYGVPLRNQWFYILHDDLAPCPAGEPGELFIGGRGLAREYWNDPDQTAEHFIKHPITGQRLYRTGDLGRWRWDGTIEFLGRVDRQVKVQGHRIELGEIEVALAREDLVRQAVVEAVKGPDGGTRLAAYVTLRAPRPEAEKLLREKLRGSLPEYMVPSRFVVLDRFSVTSNGKIDHRALPNPFNAGPRARRSTDGAQPVPTSQVSEISGFSGDSESVDNDARNSIVAAIKATLRCPDLDLSAGLLDAGATSIDVVRLANALEDELGSRPEFLELVEFSSIAELVDAYAARAYGTSRAAVAATPDYTSERSFEDSREGTERNAVRLWLRTVPDAVDGQGQELRICVYLPPGLNAGLHPGGYELDVAGHRLRPLTPTIDSGKANAGDGAASGEGRSPGNAIAVHFVAVGDADPALYIHVGQLAERLRTAAHQHGLPFDDAPLCDPDVAEQLYGLPEGRVVYAALLSPSPSTASQSTASQSSEPPSKAAESDLESSIAPMEHGEPFPLTEMQLAYLFGRADAWLGRKFAPFYYTEVELDDLDLARFGVAFNQVIERHPMFRAVLTPDVQQRIQDTTSTFEIPVLDLRSATPEQTAGRLAEIRDRYSHQVMDPADWPTYDLRATRLDDRRWRLHFGLDLVFCDAYSAMLVSNELCARYVGTVATPMPGASFAEWVLDRERREGEPAYRRSLEYWHSRAGDLPPAPSLPARRPDEHDRKAMRFSRRRFELPPATWARLQEEARRHRLTASGVLLAAFAEVLTAALANPRFTLNLTFFDRPPGLDHVVGDFTSTVLIGVDHTKATFADRATTLQRQLWRDIEHAAVHGNVVLRELAQRWGGPVVMPVVFSSGIVDDGPQGDASQLLDGLGETVYAISQTPHVLLDNQVFQHNGSLRCNWDAVDILFPDGYLDELFATYEAVLRELADNAGAWDAGQPAGVRTRLATLPTHPRDLALLADLAPRPGQDHGQIHADGPVEPATGLERDIAEIFASILGCEVPATAAFVELGANSLQLVQAHRRLRKELTVDLSVVALFEFPTVRSLAAHLTGGTMTDSVIVAARERGRRRAAAAVISRR